MRQQRGLEAWGSLFAGKRSKWITLLVWIIVTAALSLLAPAVSREENNNAALLPAVAPSTQAQNVVEKEFPNTTGDAALIVWYRKTGLTQTDFQNIRKFTSRISQHPVIHQKSVPPLDRMPLTRWQGFISKDATSMVIPVTFPAQVSPAGLQQAVAQLNSDVAHVAGRSAVTSSLQQAGLHVRITGPAGVSADAQGLFKNADVKLLAATSLLVLVLLILLYQSPLLALVPLISVGFAYAVTSPILGWMAKSGIITVDAQGISIMTVLLFGAGTDYCLFLVARYRELLYRERDKHTAIRKSVGSAGGAVAMSGLTVAISLLTLLLAKYGSDHRFAIPFSLAIFVMVLTGLTLVPALLAIFGRSSFFPFVPRTESMLQEREARTGRRAKRHNQGRPGQVSLFFGRLATERPWFVVVSGVVVLTVLASFALQIKPTYDLLSSFPKTMPSREGYQLLSSHFNSGELAPVQVVIEDSATKASQRTSAGLSKGTSDSSQSNTTTTTSTGAMGETTGAAEHTAAGTATSTAVSVSPLVGQITRKLDKLSFVQSVSAPQQSTVNGRYQLVTVNLKDNPYSMQAMAQLPQLKSAVASAIGNSMSEAAGSAAVSTPVAHFWIGGITAQQYDTQVYTHRDTRVILPIVIGMIALLLLLYLKSMVAMVYLMGTVLLSYFSALGLGWIVLHYLFGTPAIAGAIPLYAFVFLVALGEDYNIFMVSRIWQAASTVSIPEAIMEGTSKTSSVITSAGLILAGTFSVLIALPLQILVQFGTVTALGVLIDTFIVRPLVVPAFTRILGTWAFWPSQRQRV